MERPPIWLMDGEDGIEDSTWVEAIVDAAEARRFVEREYDGLDPFFHFMPPSEKVMLYPSLPDGWDDLPVPAERRRALTLDEALAIPYEEEMEWRTTPAAEGHAGVEFWRVDVHELDRADVERLIEAKAELELSQRGQVQAGAALETMIAAMRAAVIEWRHGRGAEAGMAWIENTLDGPDLLPEGETDAQAFYDRERERIAAWEAGRLAAIEHGGS